MSDSVKTYYEKFAQTTFVRDYLMGNRRVEQQYSFLKQAVPPNAKRILIVGCGYGDSARFLVDKVASGARIFALDLSSNAISFATQVYHHPAIEFRQMDIIENDPSGGPYDVIIFPDVYEHIPTGARPKLHSRLGSLLSERGRIVLTCPTPAHQNHCREKGKELQVIDEDVGLEDYQKLAKDVQARVSFYALRSIFRTGDYAHVVVERGLEEVRNIDAGENIGIRGRGPEFIWAQRRRRALTKLQIDRLVALIRKKRLKKVRFEKPMPGDKI